MRRVEGERRLVERNTILRRLYVLWLNLRDHRFERGSPIPPVSDAEAAALFTSELVFPPRRDLVQPGMQTVEGLFALGSLAKLRPASGVFEIGTYRGVTTWFLARNLPEASVHTLDIRPERTAALPLEASDEFRATRERMYYELQPGANNVTQHWGDSATFDFTPWYGRCDLVYVDGAHSEDYVTSDTENALKMLSDDGVIVWDDYWRESPGTVAVLHRYHAQGLSLRRIPRTRLVVHARGGIAGNA